jgi:hypothetical protein
MRTSISFLTTTTATAPVARASGVPHALELLGLDRTQRTIYFVESVGGATPLVHVMHLDGEHAGRLTVARSLYDGAPDRVALRVSDRIALLRASLEPLEEVETDAWLLTTRVLQRRALRIPGGTPPIRKFVLALAVEPIATVGDTRVGKTTVTAYLRARASLDRVWLVPALPGLGDQLAIARITYLGVPSEVGHDKQTAVLTGMAR